MHRAASLFAACTFCWPLLAGAQEFPNAARLLYGDSRLAQAPAAVKPAPAPQPKVPLPAPINPTSLSEIAPTPSMWFYEQERLEREDPRNAVRAKAEYRSEQRSKRLAALQWFGYSNARPVYAVTPYTSTAASPQWGSNTIDPYLWRGTSRSAVVYLPATPYWR
jgi:hypothetical protein